MNSYIGDGIIIWRGMANVCIMDDWLFRRPTNIRAAESWQLASSARWADDNHIICSDVAARAIIARYFGAYRRHSLVL